MYNHQNYTDTLISIHKMESSSAFLSCKTGEFCKYGTERKKKKNKQAKGN